MCCFCKQSGHTSGHCPVRKGQNRDRRRDRRQTAQVCDSTGSRICGAKFSKPSTMSVPSRTLTSANPFMACVLIPTDEVRKSTPTQDRFECEKCGFQHSCLEVVEEHEASCVSSVLTAHSVPRRPRSEVSWADMAEDPDAEIDPPLWDDEMVFPALESSDA